MMVRNYCMRVALSIACALSAFMARPSSPRGRQILLLSAAALNSDLQYFSSIV